MTQYDESVEQQRQILELEKQAKQVIAIDTRYKDGQCLKCPLAARLIPTG